LVDGTGEEAGREFSCPGIVRRGLRNAIHPMTAGLDR